MSWCDILGRVLGVIEVSVRGCRLIVDLGSDGFNHVFNVVCRFRFIMLEEGFYIKVAFVPDGRY